MIFVKESAPHIRRKDSLRTMFLNLIIALCPVIIWACVVYPMSALRIFPLALGTCVLSEFLFVLITKKNAKAFTLENALSAIITGCIYSLTLPPSLSWGNGVGYFVVVFGAAFGIIVGKLLFGGIGSNIFNPAALGMIVVRLFWSGICKSDAGVLGFMITTPFDETVSAGATALGYSVSSISKINLLDLFLGRVPGAMGETFHIAILVGLAWLLITKTIDWRTFVSYMGTFVVLVLCCGLIAMQKVGVNPFVYLVYQLFSGGILFASVFMITDPVTGPVGSPARVIYGSFAAIMALIIRLIGTYPDGAAFGILLANMLACVLDNPKWSSAKWKKWHVIALVCEVVIGAAVLLLTLEFKEGAIK